MSKIYIVERGAIYDYHYIDAVFSNLQDAIDYVETIVAKENLERDNRMEPKFEKLNKDLVSDNVISYFDQCEYIDISSYSIK